MSAAHSPFNVAVIGLGFMGATHARAWTKVPGARLAAVVSSDPKKLSGDLSSVGGNLEVPADPLDLSTVRKCSTLEEALRDPHIDAVDICLPTDRHAPATMESLAAGKHVLVEKPLALNPGDCRSLIAEAAKRGRVLMAGHILRFLPAWSQLAEALNTSGPVRFGLFRRRCAAPDWSPWLTDPRRSGGGVFDLLIHDADFCIWVWGMPESVRATGYERLSDGIDVVNAELHYPDRGPVIITGGWHHPKSYPFSMEFTVVTDRRTLDWRSGEDALRVYDANGEAELRTLNGADAFVEELKYFSSCAIAGAHPDRCPPEQSAKSVELMLHILESRAQGGNAVGCR